MMMASRFLGQLLGSRNRDIKEQGIEEKELTRGWD